MAEAAAGARLYVIAGVNGAGKSSVLAASTAISRTPVFNADVATQQLLAANPGVDLDTANSIAWQQGVTLLETAIRDGLVYAFETTLGGRTITDRLLAAALSGAEIRMLYIGVDGVDVHAARVRNRVKAGGHDVPMEAIQHRYIGSRANLIRLIPHLTDLRLFDNTEEADPRSGLTPKPILLLHAQRGRVVEMCGLDIVPDWAKPIVAAAIAPP
ncbi:MAG: ZTL protein [Candidatus Dormibacteraeota bacterium]|nr:ZTL protein [Candidatus Dormibacteraeota bacterium]